MTGTTCRCGDTAAAHLHYASDSTYCSVCEDCWQYKPARPWHRWLASWQQTQPARPDLPPAETATIRPRPVPLPLPGDDTRTRLRVPPWLDAAEPPRNVPPRQRGKHASAPWEQ